MKYNLSIKNSAGKWWSWGSRKQSDKGYWQTSFKVTPEFLKLVQDNFGGWLNFSEFEDTRAPKNAPAPKVSKEDLNDDIPF